jgi:hypothetical protein
MPENTNPIVYSGQLGAVRNLLAEYEAADSAEQLPAGTYAWRVELTWPARRIDLTGWGKNALKVGQHFDTIFSGSLSTDAPTARTVLVEHLWRGITSGSEVPIPNTTLVTDFTLTPAGGGQ